MCIYTNVSSNRLMEHLTDTVITINTRCKLGRMKCDNAISPFMTTCDNTEKLFATYTTKNWKSNDTPTKAVACMAIANKPRGPQFPSQSTWHWVTLELCTHYIPHCTLTQDKPTCTLSMTYTLLHCTCCSKCIIHNYTRYHMCHSVLLSTSSC